MKQFSPNPLSFFNHFVKLYLKNQEKTIFSQLKLLSNQQFNTKQNKLISVCLFSYNNPTKFMTRKLEQPLAFSPLSNTIPPFIKSQKRKTSQQYPHHRACMQSRTSPAPLSSAHQPLSSACNTRDFSRDNTLCVCATATAPL